MTPENARALQTAVVSLGSADADLALTAARCVAAIIAAEGVKPNAVASAMVVAIDNMSRPVPPRGFAELGPIGTRKRLAELSARRGITADDKARIMALREKWPEARRLDLTPADLAWLDGLWNAPPPARARKAS